MFCLLGVSKARNKELFFGYIHLSYSLLYSLLLVVFLRWNRIRFIHTAAIYSTILSILFASEGTCWLQLYPSIHQHETVNACCECRQDRQVKKVLKVFWFSTRLQENSKRKSIEAELNSISLTLSTQSAGFLITDIICGLLEVTFRTELFWATN